MNERLQRLVTAWMDRARADLGAARLLIAGQPAYPAVALFHCQQAGEKALKAYLAAQDQPLQKTHDLETLIEQCETFDPGCGRFRSVAAELTPFATEFRYPSSEPDPPLDQAQVGIEHAQQLFDYIIQRLAG